jgi:hypothetical protein
VEQIAAEEDHIDIVGAGELHHLVERPPTIVLADRISLLVSDMVIGGD